MNAFCYAECYGCDSAVAKEANTTRQRPTQIKPRCWSMFLSLCRLTCLSTCLDLVKRCCLLYKDLMSFSHIFQPIRTLLSKHLSAQALPDPLKVGVSCFEIARSIFFNFSLNISYRQFFLTYNTCVVAGAPQWDPGDHQRCSCGPQSADFREEEAHSSEAAHTQDCWNVSVKWVQTFSFVLKWFPKAEMLTC